MNKTNQRRPSASLIIACLALFVALGGGAYAVSKANVTSKQIKNGSVKGKDLKNDTLTGKQIKEGTLGQVPSAASADTAGDSARVGGVEVINVQPFTLTNGQTKELFQRGAFTLTATCSINEGGNDIARVLISTSVNNAAFDGDGSETDLDATTPAADREYQEVGAAPGSPGIDQESDGAAIAPDGSEILGNDAVAAVNLPQDGIGVCKFAGAYYVK